VPAPVEGMKGKCGCKKGPTIKEFITTFKINQYTDGEAFLITLLSCMRKQS